ncbi:hypothetical protein J1614_011147 [Plenodomus biglobosus]|nr:hypothetical protein J1614_011147 [Plenodomus biglobosus]
MDGKRIVDKPIVGTPIVDKRIVGKPIVGRPIVGKDGILIRGVVGTDKDRELRSIVDDCKVLVETAGDDGVRELVTYVLD